MASFDRISFTYRDIVIPYFEENSIKKWIVQVVDMESAMISYLHIIFCNDALLWEMNRQYLNHDTYTDIITFNYQDEYEGLAGDLFISYERIKENAGIYKVKEFNELCRVIIHGVLHLLGYDDVTEDVKEIMRTKENYYLNLLA